MYDISTPIRLSIATPTYNESAGIAAVILHWHAFLTKQTDISQFEIVICNDGSTDNTGSILDKLSQLHSEIQPTHFTTNQGASAALRAAIKKTHFDWVLLIDSDDQFPIENLPAMISSMRSSHAKAVLGARNKKDHFFSRYSTKISGYICNQCHGSKIKDFNSAFKLVSGPLLRSLVLETRGMNYSTEITSRLLESRAHMVEIDIEHRSRNIGISHIKWTRDSLHRLLFVGYISLRQLLLKLNILKAWDENDN